MESKEYKPQLKSFIFMPLSRLIIILFIIGILSALVIFARFEERTIYAVFIWILLFMVFFLFVLKRYRRYSKEKYIFLEDKIVKQSGSLFSDSKTELKIRNITHVNLTLPYIEHNIFGTGHISIQSAGSGGVEVDLISVEDAAEKYKEISEMMKNNGFSLKKESVIQKEYPSGIGAFIEVMSGAFLTLISVFFFIQAFLFGALGIQFISGQLGTGAFIILGIFLVILFIFFLIARFTFRFLDLYMRVYTIYPDTITYYEGFLTKVYSYIPVENLADAATSRTVTDRIIGLYDLKLSCQGSGQELLFKNVINGEEMENNIHNLIKESRSLDNMEYAKETLQSDKTEKVTSHEETKERGTSTISSIHTMDPKKSLMPFLISILFLPIMIIFLPLLLVIIIAVAQSVIAVCCTTFYVKENSVEKRFSFLSSKQSEFSFEKITGIIVKENFIDRMFNTFTIKFWSIGSSEDITFANIRKSDELVKLLLEKANIQDKEVIYEARPSFGLKQFFMANFPFLILLVALFAGSIVGTFFSLFFFLPLLFIPLGFLITFIYKLYYYQFYAKMSFFKSHLEVKKGIFFHTHYFSRFKDIKGLKIIRFPLTDVGYMQFNIAGEQLLTSGTSPSMVSNSFGLKYIPDIEKRKDFTDIMISNNLSKELISELENRKLNSLIQSHKISRPAFANTATVILLLTPLLLVLMPIVMGILYWKIKVTNYHIQETRVLKKHGIIYRTQESILYKKIDHINSYQGFLNKVFSNGTIIVNTTGSSKAELLVKNISDYREFYDVLEEKYRN